MVRLTNWTKFGWSFVPLYALVLLVVATGPEGSASSWDNPERWHWVRPTCQGWTSYMRRTDFGTHEILHEMTEEFFKFFKQRMPPTVVQRPFKNLRRLEKRRHEPPTQIELVKLTHGAVRDVIAHRYGEDVELALTMGIVRLPIPDFYEHDGFPTCSAIEKIALEGGEWAVRGPPLTEVNGPPLTYVK